MGKSNLYIEHNLLAEILLYQYIVCQQFLISREKIGVLVQQQLLVDILSAAAIVKEQQQLFNDPDLEGVGLGTEYPLLYEF